MTQLEQFKHLLSLFPKIEERAKYQSRAVSEDAFCKYRVDEKADNTEPENCCFIGYLIPSDKYVPELENFTIGNPRGYLVWEILGFPREIYPSVFYYLKQIQQIHDEINSKDWEEFLKSVKTRIQDAIKFLEAEHA